MADYVANGQKMLVLLKITKRGFDNKMPIEDSSYCHSYDFWGISFSSVLFLVLTFI